MAFHGFSLFRCSVPARFAPRSFPLRRSLSPLLRGLLVWGAAMAAGASAFAFGYDDVVDLARKSAATSYKEPVDHLPRELKELEYDQYRDIRFRPDRALWRAEKLPFELMFFHAGRAFKEPVAINEIVARKPRPIRFDPSQFDYGQNKLDPKALRDVGYAGFRVHYAVNKPEYKDEVLVFLGASYFRAVGKGQVYGLSARGLAIDTAGPQGEEFPRFTAFWIEKPTPRANTLTIYAQLDSPRLAGAYEFVLKPGAETLMAVRSALFPRETIQKLGIAPLTSMYAFGENQPGSDDYRPEVHDSDGLSMWSGEGEWIWRPLVNPKRLLVTSFATTDPRGFGLMQRDRSFSSYEDTEAVYDRRPSTWIEPVGKWGAGRVELVQIPTPDETNDNIVAYWVSAKPVAAQQRIDLAYRMHWQSQPDTRPATAWVVQSRRGRGYVRQPDGNIKFVVDFDGPALKNLPADAKPEAVVGLGGNAELVERNLYRHQVTGGWRMTVRIKRQDASRPVELRALLKNKQDTISETWSYILPAEGDKP